MLQLNLLGLGVEVGKDEDGDGVGQDGLSIMHVENDGCYNYMHEITILKLKCCAIIINQV